MMKRLSFVLFLLVFAAFRSQAQIALEYTFTGVSAAYIKLPQAGYKFYVMDVANSQCRLYNNDHSLWKTINLSVPAGYYLYDIQFVSENLFNTDNSIELLYVSYNYNSTSSYYSYDTRIANEAGTVLLSVPGGGYSAVYPALNGSKLFVWVYDYSVSPSTVNTMVYSIPGQVITDMPPLIPASDQASMRRAFPNPATASVTIPYNLPAGIAEADLKLYNSAGMMVKSFRVDHSFDSVMLSTADLPAGIYVYRIESGSFKSEAYKLAISK
ncbi:MAG: T9SS type A sorting domain-containing protein [Bacteroidota bacterium]